MGDSHLSVLETTMKKSARVASPALANSGNGGTLVEPQPSNGHSGLEPQTDLVAILASLQTLRDGDFSVRLPGSWVGLAGKIADTFNDIAAADQQMAVELKRLGQVVGKRERRGNARGSMKPEERGGTWSRRSTRWWKICCDRLRK